MHSEHRVISTSLEGEGETHVLEGQEDGEEQSAEEQSHKQNKQHTLTGREVKLRDGGGEAVSTGPPQCAASS